MKKFNKFLSVAVASAMVMSMAGCGNTDNGSAATGTNAATESAASGSVFKIGGIGPTTGGAAVYGLAVQHGAEIAVEEINAAGGINGYQIEFKFQDYTLSLHDALPSEERRVGKECTTYHFYHRLCF